MVGACYQYTPLTTVAPESGTELRVDLTDAGAVRLAPAIGQAIESIDGRSVAVSDTSLLLTVSATIGRGGYTVQWNNERVDVPKSAISRVLSRRMDRKKTYLVSGLTVAGVFLLGKAFGRGNDLASLLGGGGTGSKQ